jgi:hypothetical protein
MARAGGTRVAAVNALGEAATTKAGTAAAAAGGLATNAIGMTVHFRRGIQTKVIAGKVIAGNGPDPIPIARSPAPAAVINGTGMTHVGSGTGGLGGPAKNVAGSINGTSFRPRHL